MENWEKVLEELFTGVMGMSDPTVWIMFVIGAVLIWLGVKKDYEPMLLFPDGGGLHPGEYPRTLCGHPDRWRGTRISFSPLSGGHSQ